jgi:hypothetical protein
VHEFAKRTLFLGDEGGVAYERAMSSREPSSTSARAQ